MKRTANLHRSWIFHFTFRLTRYLLLGLFGFVLVCLISPVFGGDFIMLEALANLLFQWAWRVLLLLLCLVAISVMVESLR
jgi:hypothetical protein